MPSLHLPSVRCLMAFETSARLESFTAAARELNTSPSSISRHIADLEAILGASLFERSKQRVRLTEQGKHLARRVGQGLDSILDGMEQVANWDAQAPVIIGCTHAISHLLIMPVFNALQSAMGDLGQVRIMTAEYAALDAHLDPQIDIRFDYDVTGVPSEDYVLLFSEAVKPVCSPEFKMQNAAALANDPRHWSSLPLLDMSLPNRGWATWHDWFRSNDAEVSSPVLHQFDNYIYLLEACAAGQGLALGARHVVESYLSAGRLVQAHEDYINYERGFYAVLSERGRTRNAPRKCLDALTQLIGRQE